MESASQLPLFLSLLLDVICKSLSPALLSQWFLVDLIRRVTGAAASVLDFCLSPTCTTTSVKRARGLIQVIASATSLLPISLGFGDAVESLFSRLLRNRLQQGPNVDWEIVDITLGKAFERPLVCPPAKELVKFTLEFLRTEPRDPVGGHRVRLLNSH